jgi:hypothetical protein
MKSRKKSQEIFHCKKCDYTSKNKFDFNKHLSTTKHKMVTNGNENGNFLLNHACDLCYKSYKYKSGLSRHKKKCTASTDMVLLKKSRINNKTQNIPFIDVDNDSKDPIALLAQALSKQGDLIDKLIQNQNEMIPKLGNNNNNKIAINVFLNEHCKDAMNITDFVDNIKVSLEDLEYTNQHGYVKGISNIFTKHLTDMKITERPIHCSDKKRMQLYIKDNNKWGKDMKNEKIDRTIQRITKKQILKIKEWENQHPDYLDNESLTKEWHKMIFNMTGGENDNERSKLTATIKKNISENVSVKDVI